MMVAWFVSGNSPLVPAQKEYPQVEMECSGIVVSGSVSSVLAFSVCSWSRSMTHGRVCVRGSVIFSQSKSFPTPLITVGSCPIEGFVIQCVGVGIKGLCGIVSWIDVAWMACASPCNKWGSSDVCGRIACRYLK